MNADRFLLPYSSPSHPCYPTISPSPTDDLATFSKPPPPPASGSATATARRPLSSDPNTDPEDPSLWLDENDDGTNDDENAFEEELMKGMQDLLSQLGTGGAGGAGAGTTAGSGGSGGANGAWYDTPLEPGVTPGAEEKQLQDLFAKLLAGDGGGGSQGGNRSSSLGGGGGKGGAGDTKGFEELMKEIMEFDEASGGAGAGPSGSTGSNARLPKTTSSAAAGPSTSASTSTPPTSDGSARKPPTFDQTIRQSLKNLKTPPPPSHSTSSSNGPSSSDPLTALLEQFASENPGLAGAGNGSGSAGGLDGLSGDEDFSGLLDGMMKQLMTRDILQEPLEELGEKFPPYLLAHKNDSSIPAAQYAQYEQQNEIVQEILVTFKDPGYNDSDAKTKDKVTALMTTMQDLGSPPEEIMGEMPDGMDFAAMLGGGGPEGCCVM